ncbi:MAG: hypothetical protein JWN86_4606 [Planctomycetota bacterium]|nr:hypothetical protein [Planctomycetota bacterium]
MTGPIRRPIARKIAAEGKSFTAAAIREDIQPRLDQVILGISHTRTEVGTYRNETNLLLDGLVRELTRLQDQVEILQQLVVQSAQVRDGLELVGSRDDETSSAA